MKKVLQTYAFLSDSFLEEMLDARLYTESIAVKLAARNATDTDLEKIRSANEQFHQAVQNLQLAYNYEKVIELDELVHLGFAAASHNSFFIQFIDMLHQTGYIQGDIRKTYEQHPEYFQISDKYHLKIYDAIAEHDEEAAYKLMYAHIMYIRENLSDELP